jgi:hypothetical protein
MNSSLSGFTPCLSAWSHVFNLIVGYGLIVCGTRIFACNILYIQMQLPILPPNRHECIRLLPRPNALFTHCLFLDEICRTVGASSWSKKVAYNFQNFGGVNREFRSRVIQMWRTSVSHTFVHSFLFFFPGAYPFTYILFYSFGFYSSMICVLT